MNSRVLGTKIDIWKVLRTKSGWNKNIRVNLKPFRTWRTKIEKIQSGELNWMMFKVHVLKWMKSNVKGLKWITLKLEVSNCTNFEKSRTVNSIYNLGSYLGSQGTNCPTLVASRSQLANAISRHNFCVKAFGYRPQLLKRFKIRGCIHLFFFPSKLY